MTFRARTTLIIFAAGLLPSLAVLITSAYLLNSTLNRVGALGLEQSLDTANAIIEQTQAVTVNMLRKKLSPEQIWGNTAAMCAWTMNNGLDIGYEVKQGRTDLCLSDSLRIDTDQILQLLPRKPGPGHVEIDDYFFQVYADRDSISLRGCGVLLPVGYGASGRELTQGISASASLGMYKAFSLKLLAAATAIAIVLSIIFGFVLAAFLSRQLAKPLDKLAAGVKKIGAGNYGHKVVIRGDNEFSRLADAFNIMSDEIKENQARLLRAERLAAWREVARRIAHEIKNPLTPIGIELHRLSRMIAERPDDFPRKSAASLETIKGQVRILQALAQQFSTFAKEPELRREPCSLDAIIRKAAGLFAAYTKLEIALNIPDGLPNLLLDQQMITRVLVNIIKNSAEAVDGSAKVDITAKLDEDSIMLTLRDYGPGFPQAKLDDIGQPYITSKKTGTGLGLAITKKIIDEHRGEMKIYNDPGAVVEIRIPVGIRG